MKTQNISIVSIHPDPAQPLALDIKHILEAFGPYLDRWVWCVRNLDWLGDDAEALCQRVETAGSAGLWMTSQELLGHARNVYQTIEGELLAFPYETDPKTVTARELNLRCFPASRAELAIVAVDGGFFEAYAKDPDAMSRLRRFGDVRDEDPTKYF
jgi:hypothetical protein